MGIGVSLLLIAIGLILALAVDFAVAGLDIEVIGWILVAVGVVGLVLTLVMMNSRRPAAHRGEVVEERRTYEDPPRY